MAYDPSQGQGGRGMNGPGMAMSGPGARGMGMNGPGAMMGPGGRGMSGPGAMAMSGPGAMQMQQGGLQGQQLGGMGGHQGQQMGGQGGHMGGGMQQMGSGMMPGPAGPECEVCHQGIEGQIIQAYGKNYHPNHFVCEYCSQPFPGNKFMVAPDGKLYCETDFIELHGKKCKVCNELIGGKLINIGDENGGMMAFHSEHFICVSCGTNLVGKRYRVQKSTKSVYCPGCFEKAERDLHVESHLCAKCNQMIVGHYLLINGKFIHPKHYRCQECGIEFKGGDCHEFEGDYYCKQHYENLLLKKCARCGKPCKGRSVTACNKTWHPDHFMCHVCGIILLQSNFFENDGLSYCLTDYTKLFGDNCAHCLLPIKGGGKRFLEKAYHDEHFLCNTCTKPLQPGKFTAWDNKPICTKCYNQLPDELRKTVEKRMKEEKKSKLTRQYFEKKEAKAAAKAAQSPRK